MTDTVIETTQQPWYRGPAFILTAVLMSVYAIGTFIGTDGLGSHLINVLLMTSLVLGVLKITDSRRALGVTLLVVLIGLVGQIMVQVLLGGDAYIWNTAISLVFFAVVLAFLVKSLFQAKQVDVDTVFAASSVFMLIGIVCANAFMLVHAADPTAFSLSERDLVKPSAALLHYSFTTLTTVGYGSISPMSETARMISDLEALIAQLYLAVVVSRLVSLQIEHSRQNRTA